MKRFVQLAICLAALASVCHAEPRWCSISEKDPSNKFTYPPIARAARVWGHVMMRMIYAPNGKVVRFEPISGPRLLSSSLQGQLNDWIVRTDAVGPELCQTPVIADFYLSDAGESSQNEPKVVLEPSIVRLTATTQPLVLDVVISDPAPLKGWKLVRFEIRSKLRHAFGKLFGISHSPSAG
jgi:hypothetical protein